MYKKSYAKRKPALRRRRRVYRKRGYKKSPHAPKSFVCSAKLFDVISDRSASHPDGYNRNDIMVALDQMPIWQAVSKLYGQFAITGAAFQYKPFRNVSTDTVPAVQMVFAEDKNSTSAITVKQNLSQDNARQFPSTRSFKHYVRNPRPELYSHNDVGTPILTTVSARQLHWLTNDATSAALPHLCAQFNVEDNITTNPITVGEMWVKIYIVAKEQIVSSSI